MVPANHFYGGAYCEGEALTNGTRKMSALEGEPTLPPSSLNQMGGRAIDEETPLLQTGQVSPSKAGGIIPSLASVWYTLPFLRTSAVTLRDGVRNHKLLAVPLTLFVGWLIVVICVVVFKGPQVFDESSYVHISGVEVSNITDTGLLVNVQGMISIDYGKLGWFLRSIFIPLTMLLGELTIQTNEKGVELFVNLPEYDDENFYHPVSCLLPPLTIDFTQGSINSFHIPIQVEINPYDTSKVYSQYLALRDVSRLQDIEISAVFNSRFYVSKSVPLGTYSVKEKRQITIPSNTESGLFDYTLESYNVSIEGESIQSAVEVGLKSLSVPVNTYVGKIDWDVYSAGCLNNIIYTASITTEEVQFKNGEPTIIRASLSVPRFDKSLERHCPDGLSPINRSLKKFLESSTNVFVSARVNSEANANLPKWLYLIITNIFQPISLSKKAFTRAHHKPLNYDLSSASIMVANDAKILPELSAQFELILDLPVPNYKNQLFNLKKVLGDLCIVYKNEIVLKIYLHSWQQTETYSEIIDLFVQGAMIDIVNDHLTAELVKKFLDGDKFETIVKAKMDMDLVTPVSTKIFQQVEYESNITIHGIKHSIDDVEIKLHDLIYITSSTSTNLRLFVNMMVTNPFIVSAGIQFVNMKIAYNNTIVGNIEISDTVLLADNSTELTTILRLDSSSDKSQQALEELLSRYISGKKPEIIITGHNDSCKSAHIANILSELSLPFTVPSFHNDGSSGFILGTIFHVMSSEVQITAYNPVNNEPVLIKINSAKVFSKDIEVANVNTPTQITLPPGVSTTRRIAITVEPGAAELLRKSINGNLTLQTIANFDFSIEDFSLNLDYEGEGVDSQIRL